MDLTKEVHDLLVALSIKHHGDARAIENDIRARAYPGDEFIARSIERLRCQAITVNDNGYPRDLGHVRPMPITLFYRGDYSLIREVTGCVAIVGSREPSAYGVAKTKEIATELARRGFSIVSGLARGIDTVALEAALPFGKAVAVIGNGLDYCYPPENLELQKEIEKRGLLLSEYPGATQPTPYSFVARNRLIAALAQVVVVTDARIHSGAMHTVNFAAALNHDIAALPHDEDGDNGCNCLIKEGAFLLQSAKDIGDILGSKGEPYFGKEKRKSFYK